MGYEGRYSKKIDTRNQNFSHMQALSMVEKAKRILEFGRRRVDQILMLDFLEHLRDPLKVLRERR